MPEYSMAKTEEDVFRLEEWLRKQPHLPHNVDKGTLRAFVLGTKTLEIAKRKLDSYFTYRSQLPNFYQFRDPCDPYFIKTSRAGQMFILPSATNDGSRILFGTLSDCFDDHFDQDKMTAALFMTLELGMLLWPDMNGLYVLADFQRFHAGIVTRLCIGSVAQTIRCFQDSYPVKPKGVVAINAPSVLEVVCNTIVKPFLKEKLFKRIKITAEDKTCLSKHFPVDILPSDYGGKEKSSTELNDEWLRMIQENRSWFELTSQLLANENKRPPDTAATYGIEGTFRKLAID